ncbi:Piwi-like protein 1 [Orchesella cincta]|uniref:Piwi-like protein 1 n=1 Tax=Orchesella cincta TaxID=48709 RepID=A0A1D2MZI7_ORCCI|nr:Piwi-like protein 1 [Orchesella cincta]
MSDQPPPYRGRARARARAAPLQPLRALGDGDMPASEVQPNPILEAMFGDLDVQGGSGGQGIPRGSPRGSPRAEYADPDYIPSRPKGFDKKGTSGKPMYRTVSNYYGLSLAKGNGMMLYNVTVAVDPPSDEMDDKKLRALVRTKKEEIGSYIITGNQLVTTRPLSDEMLQPFVVSPVDGHPTYTVTISYLRDVHAHEGCVIHFYNVVVKMIQKHLNHCQLGRHYYNPEGRIELKTLKLELWPGFMNSIRSQDGGLMMNVECCWKVLINQNIFEKFDEIRKQVGQDDPSYQENCAKAIVGKMVVTPYNPHAYKIDRIDFNANCNSEFETRNGRISYANYFMNKYQQKILQPNQPMLVARPSRRDQRRGMLDDIYLVPELCYPCGLNDQLRANFSLMKALSGHLHMNATQRVQTMQNFMDKVHASPEIQKELKAWGASFQKTPIQVNARQLPYQKILFGNKVVTTLDDKVDWTNSFRTQRMLSPIPTLQNWAIVVPVRNFTGVDNLISTMKRVAGPIGYNINPKPINEYTKAVGKVIQANKGKLDMIFIILPNLPNLDTYSAVKILCSVGHGIPSQCFLAKNLNSKGLMSICTKLVIQMNAKGGGEPWGMGMPDALKNTMVLGYDVHHGAVGTRGDSVAAMTATFSPSVGRCYSKVEKLSSREEVATKVADMFDDCLRKYFKKNQVLPERIMMYRDGVGEGQLREVYEKELEGIKANIALRYKHKSTDLPKLTYIVVNKRINTRFYAQGRGDPYMNPPPGTVVDDTVTRPERQSCSVLKVKPGYDFFLVSSVARQGCVSPTYYNVLYDESELGPNKIQLFTYKLCHLYFNWTGGVAVPAPCQNAHKLAFLAGTALGGGNAHSELDYLMHFL